MANLLHTLSTNLNLNGEEGWDEEDEESFLASMTVEVNTAEQNVDDIEDAKEDEIRSDPHPMYDEAAEVFRLLADGDGLVSREEFVRAHNGEYKVFDKLDTDSDGNVDADEWHAFLKETHEKKGRKGDQWLLSLIHTLRDNIRQHRKARAEAKKPLIQNIGEHGVTIGNL